MSIVETMGATLAEAYGPDVEFGDMARAALRAIKPEDITEQMMREFIVKLGGVAPKATEEELELFRRALAAAIAAGAEQ